MKSTLLVLLAALAGAISISIALAPAPAEMPAKKEEPAMSFVLSTPAFSNAASIPTKYTCDGADRSPDLHWSEPPAGTQSLALIVDDPDAPAGDWVHWVLFDIPAKERALPAGVPPDRSIPSLGGARQGENDFGEIGWGGPCPPPGKPHRYIFRLYALDAQLGLEPGATKAELERALAGHVLAKAEMYGTYARKR